MKSSVPFPFIASPIALHENVRLLSYEAIPLPSPIYTPRLAKKGIGNEI
jgi:hypothetical protein